MRARTADALSPFREMSRAFENVFSRYAEGEGGETLSDWAPRVDILENAEGLRILAELPGLNKDDIKISLENFTLSLTGEKKQPENTDNYTWHRGERCYGTFKRLFSLPTTVDPEKIKADYRNGILDVFLPKAEKAKPRMIDVTVGE